MLPSPFLPKSGDIVGSKYRIVSSIGAGGMGVVFEALHVETEASVALKWLSPELSANPAAVERFKVEARATGRIRHPNVVAIHDVGEHQGRMYLVMELLRGSVLRNRLAQGRCDLDEALQIMFPVMRGVAAAHAVHVLHRDLKPENIFLAASPDGLEPIPKVLDFGIAKLSSDSTGVAARSSTALFMGTYPYMCFEQLHGRADLDARVDVYALGAVLYTMLTGQLPHKADNPVDLALRMLQTDPEPVTSHEPSLPEGIVPVIGRALARDRDKRYATVDELAAALEPFAGPLRYRGQRSGPATGPVQVEAGGPGTHRMAGSSAELPGIPSLPTPFVVPPPRTASRPTNARHLPASRKMVVAGALVALAVVLGAITWLTLTLPGETTAQHRLLPPPLPPAPPPRPAGPAPTSTAPVENSDWGGEQVEAVVERPSDSLAPGTVLGNPGPGDGPGSAVAAPSDRATPAKPRDSGHRPHKRDPKRALKTVEGTELLAPSWAK